MPTREENAPATARRPFITKLRELRLGQILASEDSVFGKAAPAPASQKSRVALEELRNDALAREISARVEKVSSDLEEHSNALDRYRTDPQRPVVKKKKAKRTVAFDIYESPTVRVQQSGALEDLPVEEPVQGHSGLQETDHSPSNHPAEAGALADEQLKHSPKPRWPPFRGLHNLGTTLHPMLADLPTPPPSRRPRHSPVAVDSASAIPRTNSPLSTQPGSSAPGAKPALAPLSTSTPYSDTKSASSPLPAFPRPRGFSLTSLPALTHHSAHVSISLHPPSHLTLTLRDLQTQHGAGRYTYNITTNSGPITVHDNHRNTHQTYTPEDLPWKHVPAYRYARRFVASVRRRTPLAYGGVEGAWGKLWADGRAVIHLRDVIVELNSEEAVVDGMRIPLPVPSQHKHAREVAVAGKLYQWLSSHPPPVFPKRKAEDAWQLTEDTAFVKELGWCRDRGGGRWSMKFVDGVRLEIGGNREGEVVWVEDRTGGSKVIPRGLEDEGVRRRVKGFVQAGL